FRLQGNITPDLSIQYYGSPFTSVAQYDRFKFATNTLASKYADRFQEFTSEEISASEGLYNISNPKASGSFTDPNFSFNEFRSNLVGRSEYKPESTLYLVCEYNHSGSMAVYQPGGCSNIDQIWVIATTNTFMLKANYWRGW